MVARVKTIGLGDDREGDALHDAAYAALMQTDAGREAYAEARQPAPLGARLRLFERIVDDALRAMVEEGFRIERFAETAPAANAVRDRAILAPTAEAWRACAESAGDLASGDLGFDVSCLLRDAARALREAAHLAELGESNDAARRFGHATRFLDGAAALLGGRVGFEDARAQTAGIFERVRAAWPARELRAAPEPKEFHDFVEAGERSQDLKAVARWLAPVLGRDCVAAGIDSVAVREVGNTLSRGGGGLPQLAKTWPETRARIQAVADQSDRATTAGASTPAARSGSAADEPADDGAVALGVVPDTRILLIGKKQAAYGHGSRGGVMRVDHCGVRLLVSVWAGSPPPVNAGSRAISDIHEALARCGASQVRIHKRGSSYEIVGHVSPTDELLTAIGIRRRRKG